MENCKNCASNKMGRPTRVFAFCNCILRTPVVFSFSLQREMGLRLGKEIAKPSTTRKISGTTHACDKGPSFTEVKHKDEVESGLQIPFAFVSTKKSDPVQRGLGYRPRQSIPHQRTCGTACQPGTQNFPI